MEGFSCANNPPLVQSMLQIIASMSSGSSVRHSQPTQSSSSQKRLWKKSQVEELVAACKTYALLTGKPLESLDAKDFLVISSRFPQTTSQCIIKFREIITSGTIKAGAWSEEEDQILKQNVEEGNKNWRSIGKLINSKVHGGLKVRTGKKCKERWLHYFDPEVKKGGWKPEEDLVLLEEYKKHGSRWKIISNSLEQRIDSTVKNRLKSLINYERQEIGSLPEEELLERAITKAKNKIGLHVKSDY